MAMRSLAAVPRGPGKVRRTGFSPLGSSRTLTGEACGLFALGSGFLSFAIFFGEWPASFLFVKRTAAAQFKADSFFFVAGPYNLPFRQADFAGGLVEQSAAFVDRMKKCCRGFSAARGAAQLVVADFFGRLENVLAF